MEKEFPCYSSLRHSSIISTALTQSTIVALLFLSFCRGHVEKCGEKGETVWNTGNKLNITRNSSFWHSQQLWLSHTVNNGGSPFSFFCQGHVGKCGEKGERVWNTGNKLNIARNTSVWNSSSTISIFLCSGFNKSSIVKYFSNNVKMLLIPKKSGIWLFLPWICNGYICIVYAFKPWSLSSFNS